MPTKLGLFEFKLKIIFPHNNSITSPNQIKKPCQYEEVTREGTKRHI
ncbi:hypothetical protein GCM10010301_73260 [Streptomyces plicatus]|nr:hypothetical protein GCM10010301_73260 [Streptomyces plicatus]